MISRVFSEHTHESLYFSDDSDDVQWNHSSETGKFLN